MLPPKGNSRAASDIRKYVMNSFKGENNMTEKKYLKWYNKIGYGSGDIAGNTVYAFITAFMMIYLTDTAGLWEHL